MATFLKHLSSFSLIMLLICSHAQARESKFFSKYLHLSTKSYVTIPSTNPNVVPLSSPSPSPSPTTSQISGVPASAPAGPDNTFGPAPGPATLGANYGPAPAPSLSPSTLGADYGPTPAPTTLVADNKPTPAPPENDIPYYGLYAKDTINEEEEFSSENPEELNERESYTYNKGESKRLSGNNGFWTSNHKSYYDTNNGYGFNGGYESEPQGMSDTRVVENVKYYYNVGQGNYNPSGFSSKNENEKGYYGNYKSKYEFDSMEEFEKQEGYADVQQEFIP